MNENSENAGNGLYVTEQVSFVEFILEQAAISNVPISFLSAGYFDPITEKWNMPVYEVLNGSNTVDPNDPDGDMLSNTDEGFYRSDKYDADSDDDGITDGWEESALLSPFVSWRGDMGDGRSRLKNWMDLGARDGRRIKVFSGTAGSK